MFFAIEFSSIVSITSSETFSKRRAFIWNLAHLLESPRAKWLLQDMTQYSTNQSICISIIAWAITLNKNKTKQKQSENIHYPLSFLSVQAMALTADQVLTKIDSFGRYQLCLLIFASILGWFWFAWPLLLSTFIAAEPGWRCVANSTECQIGAIVYPGDNNYDLRCNMSRGAWEFVGEYTSVVTQVQTLVSE